MFVSDSSKLSENVGIATYLFAPPASGLSRVDC